MRSFVALVGYEIRGWQGLVWAGALLGAIGWAAPLLPGMSHAPPAEARQATAAVLAALVAVLGPVFVGSSLVARDLAAGRFGFFLTLPVSAGRLWAAKVVGAAAAVYLALLLVVFPGATAVTIAPDLDIEGATLAWWAFAVALAPLALLLLSHLFGLALRARNAWLLVDVIALALVGGAVLHWVTGLWRQGAVFESVWGLSGFLLLGIGALLVAGWRQVVAGDLLLERARRVYGRWAWSLVVVATLALGVWTWWVRSATPSDIVMVTDVVLGPDAALTLVRGEVRGRPSYRPWFLLYGEDRWANVGWFNSARVVYFADGRKVAWVGDTFEGPALTVVELDDEGGVRYTSPEVPISFARSMVFSPDGDQIATFLGPALTIFDLPSGRLVSHHRVLMRGIYYELFWADEGIIRVVGTTYVTGDRQQLQVADVYLGSGQVLIREPISPSEPGGSWQQLSPDGSRLLAGSWGPVPRTASLRRSDDASIVATFGNEEWGVADASFLADGRVVLAELHGASARLRFVDSEGAELGVVELGEAAGLEIAGERAPGRLVLTIRRGSGGEDRTTLCEVDTDRSPASVTLLDEVAGRLWRGYTWYSAKQQRTAGAFVDDRGSLRRFDFQSRSWRVLAGPGSTDP